MALLVPNLEASPTFDAQAIPDSTDNAAQNAAGPATATGVTSGCQVTPQGSPNMTVVVAAGSIVVNGSTVVVAGTGSLAIAAADATDRKDIVVVSNTGVISVVKGTDCGTAGWTKTTPNPLTTNPPPVKPAIPANSVMLAEVYVAASTTSITSGNIIDKTMPSGQFMALINGVATAALNMGGFQINNGAPGVASTDFATVGQIPGAIPLPGALNVVAHSYGDAGTSSPMNFGRSVMARVAAMLGATSESTIAMVEAGGFVTAATPGDGTGWGTYLQRILPPMALGLTARANNGLGQFYGLAGQVNPPPPQVGQPTTITFIGINDINEAYGFGTGNVTATLAAGGPMTVTSPSNVGPTGTYAPGRNGGNGIRVGDLMNGTGIRGYAQVASVAYNPIDTLTGATNSGTTISATGTGTYVVGEQIVVAGATGTWTSINGTWTVTVGGTGSFQFVVSSAPTGSISGTVTVAANTVLTFANTSQILSNQSAQSYGLTFNATTGTSNVAGAGYTALVNSFSAMVARHVAGGLIRSDDFTGTNGIPSSGTGLLTYSGTWTQTLQVAGNTGPSIAITTQNGASVSTTLNSTHPGGMLSLIGVGTSDLDTSNCAIIVNGTVASINNPVTGLSNVGTTVTVTANNNFVAGQLIGFTGVVSGGGGAHPYQTLLNNNTFTVSATGLSGTQFQITVSSAPTDAWTSGGNAGPAFKVAQAGWMGNVAPVVARIKTTANDAGGTIVVTFDSGTGGSNDLHQFMFDSINFDAPYQTPFIMITQPLGPPGAGGQTGPAGLTAYNALNAAMAQVVTNFQTAPPGGFPSVAGQTPNYTNVVLADFALENIKKAFWIASPTTVTTSTTSLTIYGQRYQGDQQAPYIGQRLAIPTPNSGDYNEIAFVTSVTPTTGVTIGGNTYPAWNVTINRNAVAGTGDLQAVTATGSTASLGAGTPMYDVLWNLTDYLHPGDIGSSLVASLVLQTYQAVPNSKNIDFIAAGALRFMQNRTVAYPRAYDGGVWSPRGLLASFTPTTNIAYALRYFASEWQIVTGIGIRGSGSAGTQVAYFGILFDSNYGGYPGDFLTDFNGASVSIPGTSSYGLTNQYVLLPPGWYWLVVALNNGTPTTCKGIVTRHDEPPIDAINLASLPAANANNFGIIGYSWTPTTSGALITNIAPTAAVAPGTANQILGAASTAVMPLLWIQRTVQRFSAFS